MLSADLQSEQVAINKDSKCCIHMGLKQILLNISIVSQTIMYDKVSSRISEVAKCALVCQFVLSRLLFFLKQNKF